MPYFHLGNVPEKLLSTVVEQINPAVVLIGIGLRFLFRVFEKKHSNRKNTEYAKYFFHALILSLFL